MLAAVLLISACGAPESVPSASDNAAEESVAEEPAAEESAHLISNLHLELFTFKESRRI